MELHFDLNNINEKDINKLNLYIDKCVSKLLLSLNDIYNNHISLYKKEISSEGFEIINYHFSELRNYLTIGYELVKCSDLFLKWYFLEQFWFLVNSRLFLNANEKNVLRGHIEYIEHKLNLLIKKSNGKFSSRLVWL